MQTKRPIKKLEDIPDREGFILVGVKRDTFEKVVRVVKKDNSGHHYIEKKKELIGWVDTSSN